MFQLQAIGSYHPQISSAFIQVAAQRLCGSISDVVVIAGMERDEQTHRVMRGFSDIPSADKRLSAILKRMGVSSTQPVSVPAATTFPIVLIEQEPASTPHQVAYYVYRSNLPMLCRDTLEPPLHLKPNTPAYERAVRNGLLSLLVLLSFEPDLKKSYEDAASIARDVNSAVSLEPNVILERRLPSLEETLLSVEAFSEQYGRPQEGASLEFDFAAQLRARRWVALQESQLLAAAWDFVAHVRRANATRNPGVDVAFSRLHAAFEACGVKTTNCFT